MSSKQQELRAEVTNKIVTALQGGTIPWRKPWLNDPNCGFATSVHTKKHYRGVNVMLLQLSSMVQHFDCRWWATFNQWSQMGGSIKKGSKATPIIFYRPIESKTANPKTGRKDKFFILRTYNVFNLEQVEKDEGKLDKYRPQVADRQPVKMLADYIKAEEVILATGADIRHKGDKACYSRRGDFVQMPVKSRFNSIRDYYDTAFHELAHWSETRLGWDHEKNGYAMGELVAEITACYMAIELNIPQSDNLDHHNAYLKGWLDAMKGDPTYIFKASAQASKVCDFLLSHHPEFKSRKVEEEETEDNSAEEVERAA